MDNPSIQEIDRGVIITVKVVPGSSRTDVCGLFGEMLKIKVSAARERGKANHCLLRFLAEKLGLKKSAIRIMAGQTSTVKQILVSGISAEMLLEKLNLSQQSVSE